ncbi:sortase [Candidatus Daviesbacteria bacterium]|nr:sortase [Candidatus Daviesbacteria bacterium]
MRRQLSSLLIISSLILLIFIYLPFLSAYFPSQINIPKNSDYIEIPKIGAKALIIDNVDPWNRGEYEKALEKGVAKAKGFDNFFFAHSSLPPWKMTRTNTAFLRLGELKIGDQIIIHQDGTDFIHQVIDKKEVWPNEVDKLITDQDVLILQTCTPLGTDFKRLLIFAKPT